jgi:uncharacterized protein (TIGR02453 family)
MMTLLHVPTTTFAGFPPQTVHFLDELKHHNTREWFQAHRADYDAFFLKPARELVSALGERLPELGPGIRAEPKVFGSILTINRDVRFSADKTPYKTHLDLWFAQGDGPSRERPGYFLRLSTEQLMLGAGMHTFTDEALQRYRAAILDDGLAQRLQSVAEGIDQAELGGETYKRVPQGLPADHPRARWLRHSGLFAHTEQPLPREVFSPQLIELCMATFQRFQPLQQWLVDLLPG